MSLEPEQKSKNYFLTFLAVKEDHINCRPLAIDIDHTLSLYKYFC